MRSWLIVVVGAILLACNAHSERWEPRVPGPAPVTPGHGRAPSAISVGAARADLTLPPGGSTFGYAPDSRVTNGYWTRLYCRVFYFETDAGQKLAVVPCELPAMSLLLQRRVAELVAPRLHATQLMMTATHTHAGPGHFFGARQFTGVFSSRFPGFDPDVLKILSERIADAVNRAIDAKQPAKLSWHHGSEFWGLTRNRSLSAYRLNRDPYVAADPPASVREPAERAIDPSLDVLRIDRADPQHPEGTLGPIGSISLLATHPTVLRNTNQLYGGDVMGVVSRYVESRLRSESKSGCETDPLHGVINTNAGDLVPIWSTGDVAEALEVGERMGERVWSVHPDVEAGTRSVVLDSRYMEEEVTGARFAENGVDYRMCSYGELGAGAARGSSEHHSYISGILNMFSTSPHANYLAQDCQAPKKPLLGLISSITHAHGAFPTRLPFAVATIGDTLLTFVPMEMTVTAGYHARRRIENVLQRFDGAPSHVLIAGLANEYVEYVATADEYQLQDYEGSSTLFGPSSGRYVTNRVGLLAQSLYDRSAADSLRAWGVVLGAANAIEFGYGPPIDTGITNKSDDVHRQLLGTCRMPNVVADLPQFCMYWFDGAPADVAIDRAPWIGARVASAPEIDAHDIDDRGLAFVTRIHTQLDEGWVWSTLFSPRAATWNALASRPFSIVSGGSPPVASSPISKDHLPAVCTMRQARLCTTGTETDDWTGLVPARPKRPVPYTRGGRINSN